MVRLSPRISVELESETEQTNSEVTSPQQNDKATQKNTTTLQTTSSISFHKHLTVMHYTDPKNQTCYMDLLTFACELKTEKLSSIYQTTLSNVVFVVSDYLPSIVK